MLTQVCRSVKHLLRIIFICFFKHAVAKSYPRLADSRGEQTSRLRGADLEEQENAQVDTVAAEVAESV